jgi:hypothetical protein
MWYKAISTEYGECNLTHGSDTFFNTFLSSLHSFPQSVKFSSRYKGFSLFFILLLFLNSLLSLILPVVTFAVNGEILSHQKISDTLGGFAGSLTDSDFWGVADDSLGDVDADAVEDEKRHASRRMFQLSVPKDLS